jgi:predicted PurR-regulated permease PerM
MPEIQAEIPIPGFTLNRFPLMLLLTALLIACLAILWPFLSAITWAAILAYVSWPLYRVLRRLAIWREWAAESGQ